MLNSRPAIVVYAPSPSLPALIAVPKNRPPRSAADAPSVLAALETPGHSATEARVSPVIAPATSQGRARRRAGGRLLDAAMVHSFQSMGRRRCTGPRRLDVGVVVGGRSGRGRIGGGG